MFNFTELPPNETISAASRVMVTRGCVNETQCVFCEPSQSAWLTGEGADGSCRCNASLCGANGGYLGTGTCYDPVYQVPWVRPAAYNPYSSSSGDGGGWIHGGADWAQQSDETLQAALASNLSLVLFPSDVVRAAAAAAEARAAARALRLAMVPPPAGLTCVPCGTSWTPDYVVPANRSAYLVDAAYSAPLSLETMLAAEDIEMSLTFDDNAAYRFDERNPLNVTDPIATGSRATACVLSSRGVADLGEEVQTTVEFNTNQTIIDKYIEKLLNLFMTDADFQVRSGKRTLCWCSIHLFIIICCLLFLSHPTRCCLPVSSSWNTSCAGFHLMECWLCSRHVGLYFLPARSECRDCFVYCKRSVGAAICQVFCGLP